jgi:hypothetical protein
MVVRSYAGWLVAASLAATGCLGSPDDVGRSTELLAVADAPLPNVTNHQWMSAPSDCEGQLTGSETFAVADGAGDLVAALRDGAVVCVDTLESIEHELERVGFSYTARVLHCRYAAWADSVALTTFVGYAMGDPSPQPARPPGATADGDPSPQPARPSGGAPANAMDGDPSPQPADPSAAPTAVEEVAAPMAEAGSAA